MEDHNILIVEDELIIAKAIQNTLINEGYEQVDYCRTYDEAREHLEKKNYHLVLIDINLSGKEEGILLGKHLLELNAIPYIYITSYSDRAIMHKVKLTRPMGYIVKPFKTADIITNVALTINNYAYSNIDVKRYSDTDLSEVPFKLKKVVNYIHEHLEETIEIEKLAQLSGWKINHFGRNFKQYLKISPYQFILKARIEKAKTMISETDRPITDISYKLGFESHSNFSNAFIKYAGMTAIEYRKRSSYNQKSYL